MVGTYTEPWASIRDELRALFQDNEITSGTTVGNAILSDEVYDSALTDKGTVSGAIFLALSYASYYARRIRRYSKGRAGASFEWAERQRFYLDLAAKIESGAVVIGAGGSSSGAVLRAPSAVNLKTDEFVNRTGLYPTPERVPVGT